MSFEEGELNDGMNTLQYMNLSISIWISTLKKPNKAWVVTATILWFLLSLPSVFIIFTLITSLPVTIFSLFWTISNTHYRIDSVFCSISSATYNCHCRFLSCYCIFRLFGLYLIFFPVPPKILFFLMTFCFDFIEVIFLFPCWE